MTDTEHSLYVCTVDTNGRGGTSDAVQVAGTNEPSVSSHSASEFDFNEFFCIDSVSARHSRASLTEFHCFLCFGQAFVYKLIYISTRLLCAHRITKYVSEISLWNYKRLLRNLQKILGATFSLHPLYDPLFTVKSVVVVEKNALSSLSDW